MVSFEEDILHKQLENFEIRKVEPYGDGLFAKKDLEPGEAILYLGYPVNLSQKSKDDDNLDIPENLKRKREDDNNDLPENLKRQREDDHEDNTENDEENDEDNKYMSEGYYTEDTGDEIVMKVLSKVGFDGHINWLKPEDLSWNQLIQQPGGLIKYSKCFGAMINEPINENPNTVMMPNPVLLLEEIKAARRQERPLIASILITIKRVKKGEQMLTDYGSRYKRDYEHHGWKSIEDRIDAEKIATEKLNELLLQYRN
jgi:hypothetical protein